MKAARWWWGPAAAVVLAVLPECSQGVEEMRQDYQQDMQRLEEATTAADMTRVEAAVADLERSWAAMPDDEQILAVRRAFDQIGRVQFRDDVRTRALLMRLAENAIRRAGAAHLDVQFHLLDSYSKLNPSAAKEQPSEWPRIRKESAALWCDVWSTLEGAIDQTWDENDPKNEVRPYRAAAGHGCASGGRSAGSGERPEGQGGV